MIGHHFPPDAPRRSPTRARLIAALAVAGVVLACVSFAPAAVASGRRSIAREGLPGTEHAVFRVLTRSRVVALTFDDGPDPRWTPQVLDVLRHFHAHATFFDVGRHTLAYGDLVRAELAGGHETADHTVDHPNLSRLTPDAVQLEVDGGMSALLAVGAPSPTWFRPPKGLTDEVVRQASERRGLRTAFWDLCVEHYVNHDQLEPAVDRMLRRVAPGDVILAHDGGIPDRTRTMAALPLLLRGLQQRGYRVVSLSELVTLGTPTDR